MSKQPKKASPLIDVISVPGYITGDAYGDKQITTTPTEVLERLTALPPHLQASNRRFYVEAISDEAKAPMVEFNKRRERAEEAASAWGKAHGSDGFFPPRLSHSADGRSVSAFTFKRDAVPAGHAWKDAGRGYVAPSGHVALCPSKRPEGKALAAELEQLPKFPGYAQALDHLGLVTDLNTEKSGMGVGHSDGKIYWSTPLSIGDRHFVIAVNHNYDIAQQASRAAEYLMGDHPEWAPCLDYKGDPISWRPPAGWALLSEVEIDFIIAEENMRRANARKVSA